MRKIKLSLGVELLPEDARVSRFSDDPSTALKQALRLVGDLLIEGGEILVRNRDSTAEGVLMERAGRSVVKLSEMP